jgi:hypothetical protein
MPANQIALANNPTLMLTHLVLQHQEDASIKAMGSRAGGFARLATTITPFPFPVVTPTPIVPANAPIVGFELASWMPGPGGLAEAAIALHWNFLGAETRRPFRVQKSFPCDRSKTRPFYRVAIDILRVFIIH